MLRRIGSVSRDTLATATDLTKDIIANIEQGRSRINIEQAEAIAKYFGIPTACLIPNTFKDDAGVSEILDKAFMQAIVYVFNNERLVLEHEKNLIVEEYDTDTNVVIAHGEETEAHSKILRQEQEEHPSTIQHPEG